MFCRGFQLAAWITRRGREAFRMINFNTMAEFFRLRKPNRWDITAVAMGVAFASFGYFLFLWFRFMDTQPRRPEPTLGLIYSMNNHGSYYYLSATKVTQLSMPLIIFAIFALGFVGTFLLKKIPRTPVKAPWEKYAVCPPGMPISMPKSFYVSFVIFFTAWWLVCPHVASMLVSKGIILNFI